LDKWIFFIKHAADLDVVPSHADSAALREAYEIANQFGWSRQDLEIYDYWSIKEQDERGAVELAMELGLRQGIQQGMQEGEARGEQRKALETARRMRGKGFSVEQICELTGLSATDIE
jgi:predicted transposase/invertase (TIGR01784 family)